MSANNFKKRPRDGIVYLVMYRHKDIQKLYVGRTKRFTHNLGPNGEKVMTATPRGIVRRCQEHLSGNGKNNKAKFHKAINQHSKKNFHVFVLGRCSLNTIKDYEASYIHLLNSTSGSGFNTKKPLLPQVPKYFGKNKGGEDVKRDVFERILLSREKVNPDEAGYIGTLESIRTMPNVAQ